MNNSNKKNKNESQDGSNNGSKNKFKKNNQNSDKKVKNHLKKNNIPNGMISYDFNQNFYSTEYYSSNNLNSIECFF